MTQNKCSMNDLAEITKWLKEEKGIKKIDMIELVNYVPEFEQWKSKKNLKKV